MDNKDKKIVGYNENGFPIYGDIGNNNVINNINIKARWSIFSILSIITTFIPIITMFIFYMLFTQPEESKHVSNGVSFVWLYIIVFFAFVALSGLFSPMILVNRIIDKSNAKKNKKYSIFGIVLNIIVLVLFISFLVITFNYFHDAYVKAVDSI